MCQTPKNVGGRKSPSNYVSACPGAADILSWGRTTQRYSTKRLNNSRYRGVNSQKIVTKNVATRISTTRKSARSAERFGLTRAYPHTENNTSPPVDNAAGAAMN